MGKMPPFKMRFFNYFFYFVLFWQKEIKTQKEKEQRARKREKKEGVAGEGTTVYHYCNVKVITVTSQIFSQHQI